MGKISIARGFTFSLAFVQMESTTETMFYIL